ncbi:hypothetical protein Tco_0600367 [Tanacetum coccineum]|uniref:Uncharacterized protein n=1 Tax=Tanacetum coccineum TaxID=301880 RepID=A0ABQ4WBM3_9ASTR
MYYIPPLEKEELQPLAAWTAPPSSDHTPTSSDPTLVSPLTEEEFGVSEPSDTRITLLHSTAPSNSTTSLSPDHPLTQTAPTPTTSQPLYYRRTTRMAVRTQPTLSPGFSAKLIEAMALSPLSFCKRYRSFYETPSSSASPAPSLTLPIPKRYRGTSEPMLDIETEDDKSKAEGAGSGTPVEVTIADRPLGLGYSAARRHSLEIAEEITPSTFEIAEEITPGWSSGLASLTVPSPVALLKTTPAATIVVDEDEFLEVGAQLELHDSILHDHTQRLDTLPPILLEGHGQDIIKLFNRSRAVREEIHTQCFKLGSLKRALEHAIITFGALWRLVLALEAWEDT